MDKNYITDHETYFKMKEEQKVISREAKTKELKSKYYKDISIWEKSRGPKEPANYWYNRRPTYKYDEIYARHHNIIYSIVNGKTYKQVEGKVREHNEPLRTTLLRIIKEYNLNESDFSEVFNYAR